MRQTSKEPIDITRSDGYAILNFLVGHIVVLNPHGNTLFTNEAWNRFAKENGNPPLRAAGPGANYLDIWKRAVSDGVPGAPTILSGIKSVLAGKRKRYSSEYPCDLPGEQRWFALNVVPLEDTKGAVVMSHLEITRGKRAEMAVQKGGAIIQALLDSAPQSIVAVDLAGKFVLVNAVAQRYRCRTRNQKHLPEVKLLFVTMQANPTYLQAAFNAGATGYVLKSSAREEILAAVDKVLKGKGFVTRGVGPRGLGERADTARAATSFLRLSPREGRSYN